jgi:hypothetical protein
MRVRGTHCDPWGRKCRYPWGGAQVLMVLLDEGGVSREVLRRLEDRELVGHGWQAREGGRGDGHGRVQGADQVIHTGEDGGLGAVPARRPGAEPGRPTGRSR